MGSIPDPLGRARKCSNLYILIVEFLRVHTDDIFQFFTFQVMTHSLLCSSSTAVAHKTVKYLELVGRNRKRWHPRSVLMSIQVQHWTGVAHFVGSPTMTFGRFIDKTQCIIFEIYVPGPYCKMVFSTSLARGKPRLS